MPEEIGCCDVSVGAFRAEKKIERPPYHPVKTSKYERKEAVI